MIDILKTVFYRYFMLCKRLFKRASFLLILLLIPAFSMLIAITKTEDTGFVRIAVSCEDPSDNTASSLIQELKGNTNFLVIKEYDSPESAVSAVSTAKADTAWIFPNDLKERVASFAKGKNVSLARIYVREDNMLVKASREKLFGALYSDITYEIYKKYVYDLGLPSDKVTDQKLADSYEILSTDNGIISFEYQDSTEIRHDKYNYTTAPLRGLLITVMLVCGLAATLFYIEDECRRTFSNMTSSHRFLMFFGNNLAAVSVAAVFVSMAIMLSGNCVNFANETASMILHVLATTGFTVLCGCIVKSQAKLAIMLPTLTVLSLAFCPIFFNFVIFEPLQMIIPGYMYLFSVVDLSVFALPMILYSFVTIVFSFALFKLRKR